MNRDSRNDLVTAFSLNQDSVFECLSHAERRRLEACCTRKRVAAGTVLFSQGEPHSNTFFVQKGLIRTYYLAPQGKEITLAFWSEGNMVGGPDFFGSSPHIWSAKAIKGSDLWSIHGTDLRRLLRTDSSLAEWIIDAMAFKTHWISILLQHFATESVSDRVAHQLVRLAKMHGVEGPDGVDISHEFTQEDLATMVGATRQWVSMVLGQLQKAGLITMKDRRLVILDVTTLNEYAQKRGEAENALCTGAA